VHDTERVKEPSAPQELARHLDYLLRRYRTEIERTSLELRPPVAVPLPVRDECSGATCGAITRDSSPDL
jgi:hypothetical protein